MEWESKLKLSEENVKEMLTAYIKDNAEKFRITPNDEIRNVHVRVGSRLEGYGFGEHEVVFLDYVEITVVRKS